MENRLSEIRKRLEAATPGPWSGVTDREEWLTLHPADMRRGGAYITFGERFAAEWSSNADFIANAPEDIAYLLAEVERWKSIVNGQSEDFAEFQQQQNDRGYP